MAMIPIGQKQGRALAFPDTCKTPVHPIIKPVPYPNIAQQLSGALKASSQKTKAGQKKVAETEKKLTGELKKAAAAFGRLEGRNGNDTGFDAAALKDYSVAMKAAIEEAQKLQSLLFQMASLTVAHCDQKRQVGLSAMQQTTSPKSVKPTQTKVQGR